MAEQQTNSRKLWQSTLWVFFVFVFFFLGGGLLISYHEKTEMLSLTAWTKNYVDLLGNWFFKIFLNKWFSQGSLMFLLHLPVLSGYDSCLPLSTDRHIWVIADSKLTVGMNVNQNVSLCSAYEGPAICPEFTLHLWPSLPKWAGTGSSSLQPWIRSAVQTTDGSKVYENSESCFV